MDKDRIIRAIESRHPDANAAEWLSVPLDEADGFLDAKNALPQKIDDETALVWYYEFDRQTEGWKPESRKERLGRLLDEMRTLSPYDTAIVAERLYGDGRFMSKSAETVAREHKMLTPPRAPSEPRTNHLALARNYMAEQALAEAGCNVSYRDKLEIVRKDRYNGDGPIASRGSRYLFMEADGRAIPVLRIVGKDTDFEDNAMELGAMAAQAPDFAGGVIVALDPDTLYAKTEFVSRAKLEPYRDQALAAAAEFMERHVIKNVPIPFIKKEGKAQLDDGQKEIFNNLAQDAAYWSEVEKGAKEKGEEARGRMLAFAESCAAQAGVPMSGLGVPKDLFTMRVKQSVDEDELAAILEMDGARESVMGMKPNPKKMEKALKNSKAPQSEWCDEVVDMKALAKFCQENDMPAAIIEEASFASNPRGDADLREKLSEGAGKFIEKAAKARMGM